MTVDIVFILVVGAIIGIHFIAEAFKFWVQQKYKPSFIEKLFTKEKEEE